MSANSTNQSSTSQTSSPSERLELANNKNTVISSFVSVIEDTKDLSLSEEKHRSPTHVNRRLSLDKTSSTTKVEPDRRKSFNGPENAAEKLVTVKDGNIPLPAKCSNQLKRLIYAHSVTSPPTNYCYHQQQQTETQEAEDVNGSSGSPEKRPIYPHLPYSPYCSPNSSPRVRRKPLRETTRVNSINDQSGDYVQLNQYKLEGAIGQV